MSVIFRENLTEEDKESIRKQLRRFDISETEIEEFVSKLHLIKKGNVYGHVHLFDVAQVVGRAIDRQNAKSITVKVSREGDDETYDGHLDIEVISVDPEP